MKRGKRIALLVVFTMFVMLVVFLLSPYFYIRQINIHGNDTVRESEIRTGLEMNISDNILFINTGSARRRLTENPFIADVRFDRDIPGVLNVTITERRVAAYIEHLPGSFLSVDDQGRVLAITDSRNVDLPLLQGLQFSRFALGEVIDVPNPMSFRVVAHYTQALLQHDMMHMVTHINVSNPNGIRILIQNIEFYVGDMNDADQKVRTINAILEQVPNIELMPGNVDVSALGRDFILSLLH